MDEHVAISISLEDLIASGCLSRSTLSLPRDQEDKHYCIVDDRSSSRANAARLSLLLAQTIARGVDGSGEYDAGGGDHAALKLSDILVNLIFAHGETKSDKISDSDGMGRDGSVKEYHNHDMAPLDFTVDPFGQIHSVTPDILSDFIGMDIGDRGAGENGQNISTGTRGQGGPVGDENHDTAPLNFNIDPFDENQSVNHDASLDFLTDFFEKNPNGYDPIEGNRQNTLGETQNKSRLIVKDEFIKINSKRRGERLWILSGMELKSRENTATRDRAENSLLIQNLGRMIYEIFCSQDGEQALPDAFSKSVSTLMEIANGNGLEGRRTKLQRRKMKSLFAELLEAGSYPAPVCRLISDMVDTGKDGSAESPLSSLVEIIEDLDQMCSRPGLYLHDPEDGFSTSNLRFGLSCYGRTQHVADFLKVVSVVECGESNGSSSSGRVESIFISGIAGSGKSFLMQSLGDYMKSQGWMVLGGKFEEGLERESQDVVFSVFDRLLADLAKMRDGDNANDAQCCSGAIKAIMDVLDRESISSLAKLLPSITELVPGIDENKSSWDGLVAGSDRGSSYWRLVFLLSSLLGAILLSVDRRIALYFDDLQWSDSTMMALLHEIIISMGKLPDANKRFLFVGLHRSSALDSEKFKIHHETLERNESVNVTKIDLPCLTRSDVTEMISAEMRLTRRMIAGLSDIVFKKTSGHPLFVVQLLNSFVRDSIVVYSPMKRHWDWDHHKLRNLQTWDSVASFIISNLSSLAPESMDSLRILACLGTRVHQSVAGLVASCTYIEGASHILSSLPILMDACIIENADSMILFSHDIIRQHIYENISPNRRRQIHLCIGIFLGSRTTLANQSPNEVYGTEGIDDSGYADSSLPHSLVSIATDHINNASELVVDHVQRASFARWNLRAASESYKKSNFQAALYYYKSGIAFVDADNEMWSRHEVELCYSLCKGAATALLALGEAEEIPHYANAIIKAVGFEASLDAHYLLIRSLESAGKNQEAVATALATLRKLGFDLPSSPQLYFRFIVGGVWGSVSSTVVKIMANTEKIILAYDLDGLVEQVDDEVDKSKRDVLNILDAVYSAATRTQSLYMPLMICEGVNFSLEQECICGESALPFVNYGYMRISWEDDYEGGRRWGLLAQRILDKSKLPFIRTRSQLQCLILIWNRPLRESSDEMFKVYEMGMKYGDVTTALFAVRQYLAYLYYAGEKLHLLSKKCGLYLKEAAKYNQEVAKIIVLDKLSIDFLIENSCDSFSVFEGMIWDENSLLADALSRKNTLLVMGVYLRRFFASYWMENFSEARKWAEQALSQYKFSGSNFIKLLVTGYRGIIAFQMHRDGEGEKHFNEGKELLDELEKWVKLSDAHQRDKVHLLRAEYYASLCDVKMAKESYQLAIRSSRNYGYIHDQAGANELWGRYLWCIGERSEAIKAFKEAHTCYTQWGAVKLARKIQEKYLLDLDDELSEKNSSKHGRGW